MRGRVGARRVLLHHGLDRRLVGVEGRNWPEPFGDDLVAGRHSASSSSTASRKLSKVDWKARGLEGFGKPDNFHERQVDRGSLISTGSRSVSCPAPMTRPSGCATTSRESYVPGILHGDYQFANVMFHHGAPGRLAAIVDWEMATVGDPLLDLGWVMMGWPEDPNSDEAGGYVDYHGMPTRDEMLEYYANESGRPVDEIDYYVILARFKIAIVLEGGYAALRDGRRRQPAYGGVRPHRARDDGERGRARGDHHALHSAPLSVARRTSAAARARAARAGSP